jgi:hypothetical protein
VNPHAAERRSNFPDRAALLNVKSHWLAARNANDKFARHGTFEDADRVFQALQHLVTAARPFIKPGEAVRAQEALKAIDAKLMKFGEQLDDTPASRRQTPITINSLVGDFDILQDLIHRAMMDAFDHGDEGTSADPDLWINEGFEQLRHSDPGQHVAIPNQAPYSAFSEVGVDLKSMSYIAHGKFGAAYDIGGERVAKFTTDLGEATTSAFVRDHGPLTYTWTIHHVFELTELEREAFLQWAVTVPDIDRKKTLHLIIGEKLIPLQESERLLTKQVYRWLKDVFKVKNSAELTPALAAKLLKTIDDAPADVLGPPIENGQEWKAIMRWYIAALSELQQIGVGFRDYHSKNVMKAPGGGHKLIDLGLSSSPVGDLEPLSSSPVKESRWHRDGELWTNGRQWIASNPIEEWSKDHKEIRG